MQSRKKWIDRLKFTGSQGVIYVKKSFSFMKSWISEGCVQYEDAVEIMEKSVQSILNGNSLELIWALQHMDVYTFGRSTEALELAELITLAQNRRIPVVESKRGGRITYHGPGQLVIYLMLNLKNHQDIRWVVKQIQLCIIRTLAVYEIEAFEIEEKIGVWVRDRGIDCKIASIGLRLHKWITSHGLALNISPNLQNFTGFASCGMKNCLQTSMAQFKTNIAFMEVANILITELISALCPHLMHFKQ